MSVRAAVRAVWRITPARDAVGADARVRRLATAARAPETPIERLLVDTLVAEGPLPPRVLVSRVARALYRDELAHGGWLADLGLLGERLFVPDVVRTLDAAAGVLWTTDPACCCRG